MQCPTIQHRSEILLRRLLFLGMDVCQKGLAHEEVGLFTQMAGEDRVEVDKVQLRGEERPVWHDRGRE